IGGVRGYSNDTRFSGGDGQNCAAARGDDDRVLELRGELAVGGHDGPAVGEEADLGRAQVDHRLDRDGHTRAEAEARAADAHVRDVWVRMHLSAYAMAAEVAHHAAAGGLRELHDRGADVAEPRTFADDRDARVAA